MYDLDNYEEFARTGVVMSYDLLFNLNENLEYVEEEFQIDNNPHYARQRANVAFVNCKISSCPVNLFIIDALVTFIAFSFPVL